MENITVTDASSEGVVHVTITRPKVLNALNAATINELRGAFEALQANTAVRVVVLSGAGDKAFVAGADIAELARMTPIEAREVARRGQELCDIIAGGGKPVVAAINGFALGGGCELAMACTLRIAADTAKIGQPEINLGLIPGFGGTQRLPRLIGTGPALEILLTGAPISAEVAWRLGLVNRVVSADLLRDESDKLAAALAAKPPVAVKYILDAVQLGTQMSLAEGCDYEASLFGLIAATEDKQEGTRAFLEKRRAEFKGQ
jgi:enoyl-CoA hydratase